MKVLTAILHAAGWKVRDAIGLLVLAKRRGFLDAVTPVLAAMEEHGFWIHPDLMAAARRLSGE